MIEPVYSAAENRYECGMQYRRAGRSGVMLPVISLGLWHNFGDVDTLSLSRKNCTMRLIMELHILTWLIITDLLMAQPKKPLGRL